MIEQDVALAGLIVQVSGPVLRVSATRPLALGEVLLAGELRLLAEVIALDAASATVQVYEDTSGLAPGEPVYTTGAALEAELGPGLLGGLFDGVLRPLDRLAERHGDFLDRGHHAPTLDRDRLWGFAPVVRPGDRLEGGAVVGIVRETPALEHRVLVPPSRAGRLDAIAPAGPYRVTDVLARFVDDRGHEILLTLSHRWRVRVPRPVRDRLPSVAPLVTGQRILDTFFPLPCGGAAGMPGGFGTGKTVMQQQLCRWARADVIVYVGCGERGNEMTEMLTKLPALVDPRTDRPLSERTVMIANTSNMPVTAREASIYTGVTVAEYYRDMGYDVVVLADSTSRWAEALREISGRLEEIPAEEGYPSYLASRLAAFYERAGRVQTLGGREGSVSLISAISPPGGDLSEPVTRHTQRFTRCFWTLDKARAEARLFPAISVRESYSESADALEPWWTREVGPGWSALRSEALELLEAAERANATARLVGAESLPQREQFVLRLAALVDEAFLRQSAYDARDTWCSPHKQLRLLELLLRVGRRGMQAIDRGVSAQAAAELPVWADLERAKTSVADDDLDRLTTLLEAAAGQYALAEEQTSGGTAPEGFPPPTWARGAARGAGAPASDALGGVQGSPPFKQ